jgi:hypothetical protein
LETSKLNVCQALIVTVKVHKSTLLKSKLCKRIPQIDQATEKMIPEKLRQTQQIENWNLFVEVVERHKRYTSNEAVPKRSTHNGSHPPALNPKAPHSPTGQAQ